MRKGQKLVNYILGTGWKNEQVHNYLFNMEDKEFDEVVEQNEGFFKKLLGRGK